MGQCTSIRESSDETVCRNHDMRENNDEANGQNPCFGWDECSRQCKNTLSIIAWCDLARDKIPPRNPEDSPQDIRDACNHEIGSGLSDDEHNDNKNIESGNANLLVDNTHIMSFYDVPKKEQFDVKIMSADCLDESHIVIADSMTPNEVPAHSHGSTKGMTPNGVSNNLNGNVIIYNESYVDTQSNRYNMTDIDIADIDITP